MASFWVSMLVFGGVYEIVYPELIVVCEPSPNNSGDIILRIFEGQQKPLSVVTRESLL